MLRFSRSNMSQFPQNPPLPTGEGPGVGASALAGVAHPHPTLPLEGEGFSGVVSGDGEFLKDHSEHAIGFAQDVVVPETDHAVAVDFDQLRPGIVGRIVGVLPTVEFDGQSGRAAGEIDDGIADGELAGEFLAQLLPFQPRPQPLFRVSRFAAEFLCYRRQSLRSHLSYTPTQPSPSRGRAKKGHFAWN